jgi:Domain of unknown function (DUF397)
MKVSAWEKAPWRKSSRSASGNCVELCRIGDRIGVRDSKNRGGAILEFTIAEWRALADGVKAGEFDYLTAE